LRRQHVGDLVVGDRQVALPLSVGRISLGQALLNVVLAPASCRKVYD
jgi:hypothetical protein